MLLHGSDRSLNFHWLIEYPFLVYSKINICCFPCLLFFSNNKSKFAKLPGFSNGIKLVEWVKIAVEWVPLLSWLLSLSLKNHVNNGTHSTAMTATSGFKERFEIPSSTLTYGYDNQITERVQHNREILKWVKKTIELCGKQYIVFRRHRENVSSNNCSNFVAILKLLAQTNGDPQSHLTSTVAKNATYYQKFNMKLLTLLAVVFFKLP